MLEGEPDPYLHLELLDVPTLDVRPVLEHLEPAQFAHRLRRSLHRQSYRFVEALCGFADELDRLEHFRHRSLPHDEVDRKSAERRKACSPVWRSGLLPLADEVDLEGRVTRRRRPQAACCGVEPAVRGEGGAPRANRRSIEGGEATAGLLYDGEYGSVVPDRAARGIGEDLGPPRGDENVAETISPGADEAAGGDEGIEAGTAVGGGPVSP